MDKFLQSSGKSGRSSFHTMSKDAPSKDDAATSESSKRATTRVRRIMTIDDVFLPENDSRRSFSLTLEGEFDPNQFSKQAERHLYRFNIRNENEKIQGHVTLPETIWVDGKLVTRPANLVVSFGILLYKKEGGEFKYLLGKPPQGNAWTVFKGLPEDGETPDETAMREFAEETSIPFPFADLSDCKKTTFFGRTSAKLLEIYLVEAPKEFSITSFDIEKVVKIDSGYMEGKPEIIELQFLTKRQAVEGTAAKKGLAKVYKSQIGILDHAQEFLNAKEQIGKSDDESN